MKLALCVATMQPGVSIINSFDAMRVGIDEIIDKTAQFPGEISTWTTHAQNLMPVYIQRNTAESNLGVVKSYQQLFLSSVVDEDILVYTHDDVIMRERGWDARLTKEFEDQHVGVVGFGGAKRHGSPDLYKVPYRLQQLARSGYLSNVDDADDHGTRFTEATDVAVLDGFVLAVRRELLVRAGGWPDIPGGFHTYDYAICALAHRYGYRVRVVGIRAHHCGGRTSTTQEYQQWAEKKGMSDQTAHEKAHRWFYENYRDVLPWVCE